MKAVQRGRFTVPEGSGVVVFLIGMRINDLRRVRAWWPPFTAMPRMLAELARRPDSGFLSGTTFVSGRTLMVRQYWRSAEDLIAYAKKPDAQHLPAWRAFNTHARAAGGAVGIFHDLRRRRGKPGGHLGRHARERRTRSARVGAGQPGPGIRAGTVGDDPGPTRSSG